MESSFEINNENMLIYTFSDGTGFMAHIDEVAKMVMENLEKIQGVSVGIITTEKTPS